MPGKLPTTMLYLHHFKECLSCMDMCMSVYVCGARASHLGMYSYHTAHAWKSENLW